MTPLPRIQFLPRFRLANNQQGASTSTAKPPVFLTRRLYIVLLLFILFLAPASPVDAGEPPENAYLVELINKGLKAKLASLGLALKDSPPGFDPGAAVYFNDDDDDDLAFAEDEQL